MADYMRDDGVIDEMDCRYLMEIEDSERRIEGEKKKFRKARARKGKRCILWTTKPPRTK